MSEHMKVLFNMLGVLLFLLPVSPEILGETGKLELDFSGKTCSVSIEKAPLRTVLTKIKKEKCIWYKVSQSSAYETISIRFSDLSIREGIERILRNFNYSLHFDQDDWLLGVTIVGKKEGADYWSKKTNSNSRRKRRKGIYPKTLSGLEYSSKELPYDSPAVKIIEE
jgi:hypothetical protein